MTLAYMVAGVSFGLRRFGTKRKARHNLPGFSFTFQFPRSHTSMASAPGIRLSTSHPPRVTNHRPSVDGPRALRAQWLRLRRRLWRNWLRHRLLLERVLEDFIERAHVGDLDVAKNVRRQVGCHVRLVVCGEEHFLDPRALGPKHFFFDAPNRQHYAGQRHFAGHG